MKKYKLKKWYPSLPQDWVVGMEVAQGDRGSYGNYSPCSGAYRDYYIVPEIVEKYSEFWEEVVEKQPLFITEDNVEIFEGDKFWKNNGWLEPKSFIAGKHKPYVLNDKPFSSKEAAEEYIIMNKPCLSINDVLFEWGVTSKFNLLIDNLKKKTKSKL